MESFNGVESTGDVDGSNRLQRELTEVRQSKHEDIAIWRSRYEHAQATTKAVQQRFDEKQEEWRQWKADWENGQLARVIKKRRKDNGFTTEPAPLLRDNVVTSGAAGKLSEVTVEVETSTDTNADASHALTGEHPTARRRKNADYDGGTSSNRQLDSG